MPGDSRTSEHAAVAEDAWQLASRVQMLSCVHTIAAHDLRDSLNSMAINLELLSRTLATNSEGDAAVQQRCLKALQQELRKLDKSIGGALDESGVEGRELRRVDLASLIESTMSVLCTRAQRQGVKMTFTPPNREVEVAGRPRDLKHAIFNLAVNALDAMRDGGHLSFGLSIDGLHAVVELSDTGAGISAELESRLWEPRFSTKPNGLGFGLYVVRNVATAHGGTATFVRNDSGATFVLRLPVSG